MWLSACPQHVLDVQDPGADTTTGLWASARGRVTEEAISGVVKVGNGLFLAAKGLRSGRSSGPHLGDREAPAEGSSCCAMARMHVAQPALFFQ